MISNLKSRSHWVSLLSFLLIISAGAIGFGKENTSRAQLEPGKISFAGSRFVSLDRTIPSMAPIAQKKPLDRHELFKLSKETPIFHQKELASFHKIKVIATGYYAGIESTGKGPEHPEYGITFSGVKVRRDLVSTIAADPDIFPLGTLLYIPGYGYGIVADTGSAIKGKKIDLYYEKIDDIYKQWGKRQVDVYVIRNGDGKVTEAMLDQLNQTLQASVSF